MALPTPPPRYGCAALLLSLPLILAIDLVIVWALSELVAAGFNLNWDPRLFSLQNLAIAAILSVLQQMFGGSK